VLLHKHFVADMGSAYSLEHVNKMFNLTLNDINSNNIFEYEFGLLIIVVKKRWMFQKKHFDSY